MPVKQLDYVNWHDSLNILISGSTPGVAPGDITALGVNNTAIHAKLTVVNTADAASIAAHTDLALALAASRLQASKMIKNIKNNVSYTETIGHALNIIGADDSTDLSTIQPSLTLEAKANGAVELGFGKLGDLMEGTHIYGKRGTETVFTYLSSETHSPYVDNRALLVASQPETRQYQAIYFEGKTEHGLMSDIASISAHP